MATEIIISNNGDNYFVTVNGRATFEHAPQLRNLAKSLENTKFTGISVDLATCGGMDSTFMGILAMLGLRSKKLNVPMTIFNAGPANTALLHGLGLKKLFIFKDGVMDKTSADSWTSSSDGVKKDNAQTVLEAHQTLMSADEQNVKKFEKVVELVQQDINKRNKQE